MPYSVSNNTPSAGFIQWTDVHIVYDGVDYTITSGNSSSKYIYWQLSNPTVLSGSNTYPTLGANDTIVFYNKGGTALSVLQSQVADGGLVVPGTIVSDSLATGAVTADKVQAGSITASKLVLTDLTNMIPGADLSDASAWDRSASVSIVENTTQSNTLNYSRAIKFSSAGVGEKYEVAIPRSNRPNQPRLFEVEEGAYYRIAAKALVTAGFNGNLFGILRFWDKSYTGDLYTDFQLPIFNGLVTPAATEQTFDLARIAGTVPVGRGYMEIIYVVYWGEDWNTKTRVGDAYITNPRVYRAAAADLIVDGSITAGKIQAATITADRMLITGNSPTLNRDPEGQDATAWAGSPVILTGQTAAPSNGTALANTTGSSKQVFTVDYIPVDINKNYRLEIWADQTAGTGGLGYLGLACYNSSKTNLDAYLQTSEIRSTWLGAGSYFYYGISGTAFPSNWTRYSVSFGPGEKSKIPSDTKFVRPMAILNHDSTAGVQHAVTGIRLMEKSDADLIVDGSIIASKIEAGAVTTSKLAVGDFSVLTRNWNFEEGNISWAPEGDWSIIEDITNAKSGSFVARFSGTENALRNLQQVSTEPGETFYAEAFIKRTSGTGNGYVRLRGLNSINAEVWTHNGNLITASTYTKSSVSVPIPADRGIVRVNVEVVANNGTFYADEVRMFRTSNTTLIADGAITTNKILSNQINADKIQSGQISTDKLTVLASEYVNPVSITGNINGWAGVSELGQFSSQYASYDTVEKALKVISTEAALSVAISSNSWAINHSKIYRVSMEVKKSTANGHYRIGVSAHSSFVGSAEAINTALSGLNITGYAPNRTSTITLASFDAASETTAAPTTYVTHVFYLIGANRSINDCPNHVSPTGLEADYPYILLPGEATYAQLRLLNWANVSGKLSNLLVRGISVTEVGAGQIVASNITAGAITAGKIASKAISTDSLIVTGAGAALNADPAGEDLNSWENIEFNVPIQLTGQSDTPVGTTAIANTTATRSRVATREYIPIDALKNYRLEIWAKRTVAGTGVGSLGILWYNSSRTRITTVPTGWTNNPSTYSTFGISNTTFPDSWTRYRIEFGPNEPAAIPAGAKFVRIMAFLNDSTTAGTQHAITNVRLMEKAQADLIVDGSIVAAKVAAGSITASKLVLSNPSNIILGADLSDPSAWLLGNGISIVAGTTETNALLYPRAIRFSSVGVTSQYQIAYPLSNGSSSFFQVEEGGYYRIAAKGLVTAGFNGMLYAILRFWDSSYVNYTDTYLLLFDGRTTPAASQQIINTVSTLSSAVPAGRSILEIYYLVDWTTSWANTNPANGRVNAGTGFITNPIVQRASGAELIVDGSITTQKISTVGLDAGVIKAGTIDANRIGANTISTGKLLVTGIGAALNEDPGCQDDSAWKFGDHGVTALRRTISDSVSGNSVFTSYGLGPVSVDTSKSYPVSSGKKYRLSAWARRVGTLNGTFFLRLVDYTSGSAGTQVLLGIEFRELTNSWVKYSAEYTPPTNQKLVAIRTILNWGGSSSTTNYSEITDIRLEEKTVGDLIVDGTIVGSNIAANTIETSKLLISNPTGSLLPDPTFEDQASWSNTYGGSKALFKTVTDAKAGRYVMYITAGEVARNATWYPGAGTSTIPIDISKKYRLTFYYRTINGTSGSNSYATLQQRDSTGAFAVGNGGHGFYVWARSAINTPDWTKVEAIVGAGTSYTFAANTKYVAPSFLLNWESTGAEIQISDVRFEEVVNSTLIEDGAITTDKVGANQITGGKIYAGTLEADRIRGNSLQTNSIDASKIQAGAVLAEKLAVVTFGDSALLNSGFEEPLSTDSTLPAKWTRNNVWGGNSATVYRDLSIYRSGSAGLTLFPGAGASADIRAESIPLVPGDIWYMSFWARSSGTNAATSPGFYARVRGGSTSTAINVELYAGIENTAVPIAWTKYEVNFTIPEGVTWGSPLFLNYQTNTGHAIHIDDVQFKKIITGTIIQNGAITTDKMTANTINGDRIAGNTLSGNKIIAGSIQTDRLFVTGRGAALNADPNCSDRSSWFGGNIIGISDGPGTTTSVVNTTGSYAEVQSDIIPIDINKNYRLEIYAKALAGTGTGYLGIIWYNSAQEYIPSGGVPGWENGSYSYYGRVNQAFPSTWTRYATSFGPDETRKVPGNAKYARIVALLNYSQTAGTQHGITNVRLMEKAGADLIVDGAITASKINADGISANSLTSGTIAADRIATGSITTGKIGAGEVKANNIGADQVNASHLQISNDSATDANGIFMDGTNKVILIRNAGITRVKLGFLG